MGVNRQEGGSSEPSENPAEKPPQEPRTHPTAGRDRGTCVVKADLEEAVVAPRDGGSCGRGQREVQGYHSWSLKTLHPPGGIRKGKGISKEKKERTLYDAPTSLTFKALKGPQRPAQAGKTQRAGNHVVSSTKCSPRTRAVSAAQSTGCSGGPQPVHPW